MKGVDATVILWSNSKLRRASSYHRGKPNDIIALLIAAGINDPDFGSIIIQAALTICDELKKQKQQPDEA